MGYSFEYGMTDVRDLAAAGRRRPGNGGFAVHTVAVGGLETRPTRRFWKSFFMRFGISDNVFRYFSPDEVFQRISQCAADDSLRYCIECDGEGRRRLLAVSKPNRPVIRHAEIQDLARRYGGEEIRYADGIVTSTHTPRGAGSAFAIQGDRFQHRFVMETPVDGFGHPKIHLSFLRLVCSNGMIGQSRAFRSDISLGKDIAHCIGRALESFNNEEGYAALRQRFQSAQSSWASVRECAELGKALANLPELKAPGGRTMMRDFHRVSGNLNILYGLADLGALSTKRQRVLPARCRVYDLLNFASELATHRLSIESSRKMQAFVGNLISDEYDLEGTAEVVSDFADFFLAAGEERRPSAVRTAGLGGPAAGENVEY